MSCDCFKFPKASRRDLLRASMYGVSVSAGSALRMSLFGQAAAALAQEPNSNGKILVVLELSGGNDGLNTLIPYGDDAYYKRRPNLGIPRKQLRVIDDHFGFGHGMAGFEKLYKSGNLAVVHGCGYENPSFSHFTSMAYWHTAAPNSGEPYGWVGRLADAMAPERAAEFPGRISTRGSRSRSAAICMSRWSSTIRTSSHTRCSPRSARSRRGHPQRCGGQSIAAVSAGHRPQRQDASALVREAWAKYHSPVDYGIIGLDLPKVAALIEAGMPTRLYYTSYRNNAFDTHVFQNDMHKRLLTYASDAVSAFITDLERIGRADDVVVMVFSEFGRRVPENVNLGTDHGAANLMFVAGKQVKGGQYGKIPSLTKLDAGDNLIYTTDFRRVYATMISGWLGYRDTHKLLKGDFDTFDMFQRKA